MIEYFNDLLNDKSTFVGTVFASIMLFILLYATRAFIRDSE